MANEQNNDLFDKYHYFHTVSLYKICILIEEYHEINSFYQGRMLIGIQSILFFSSFTFIKVENCKDEKGTKENNNQIFFFERFSISAYNLDQHLSYDKIIDRYNDVKKLRKSELFSNNSLRKISQSIEAKVFHEFLFF